MPVESPPGCASHGFARSFKKHVCRGLVKSIAGFFCHKNFWQRAAHAYANVLAPWANVGVAGFKFVAIPGLGNADLAHAVETFGKGFVKAAGMCCAMSMQAGNPWQGRQDFAQPAGRR